MADLHALIKLNKHELDEKRLALAKLHAELAALEHERKELQQAFDREKAAVDATGDIHFTFAKYVEKVRKHHADIDAREAELQKRIEAAKDSMMETFSELKKYEMAQAERERLEREEQKARETKEMDEVGIETFRRKEAE